MLMKKIRRMTGYCRRGLNGRFLVLLLLSVGCLLFMHGQLAMTVVFEYPFKPDAIVSNVFSCLVDATFFFLLGMLLTWGRVKKSLLVAFVLSVVLAFCNVLYSRFFGHYLPNLAILQLGNLTDGEVMGSTLTGLRLADGCFVLLAVVFGWLYRRWDSRSVQDRFGRTLATLWGVALLAVGAFIVLLGLTHDPSFETSFIRFSPIRVQYTQAPNNMLFRSGFVRRALVCYEDFLQRDLALDEHQLAEIAQEYTDYRERTVGGPTVDGPKNVIFIIVESYLAATSDLTVDGKEITPFLNRLKRDSTVYYNGHVRPNINIGESSDGQFIYMAGLMPLKSEITVNIVKDKTVCGLPAVMKEQGRIKASQIVADVAHLLGTGQDERAVRIRHDVLEIRLRQGAARQRRPERRADLHPGCAGRRKGGTAFLLADSDHVDAQPLHQVRGAWLPTGGRDTDGRIPQLPDRLPLYRPAAGKVFRRTEASGAV